MLEHSWKCILRDIQALQQLRLRKRHSQPSWTAWASTQALELAARAPGQGSWDKALELVLATLMRCTYKQSRAKNKHLFATFILSLHLCKHVLFAVLACWPSMEATFSKIVSHWRPRSDRTNDSSLPPGHATQELRWLEGGPQYNWRQAELDLRCLSQLMLEYSWSLDTYSHLSWTLVNFQAGRFTH